MGLKSFVVKKTLKSVGKAAAIKGFKQMDEKHNVDNILIESYMDNKIFINIKSHFWDEKIQVFNDNSKPIYNVEANEKVIKLLNMNNEIIGKVEFSTKDNNAKYLTLSIDNIEEKIIIKPALKIKFDIPSKKWRVEGNLMQYDFNIIDNKNNIIMKIHRNLSGENYGIEYNNKINTEFAIMIALLIELLHRINSNN